MAHKQRLSRFRLYVFLRSDLESMVPGKAAAQVAHAASQLAGVALRLKKNTPMADAYLDWEKDGGGFGTTIVKDGGNLEGVLDNLSANLIQDEGLVGQVDDPTYPIVDGDFVHLVPLTTCVWIFVDRENFTKRDPNNVLETAELYTENCI